jgi:hypothetical protein
MGIALTIGIPNPTCNHPPDKKLCPYESPKKLCPYESESYAYESYESYESSTANRYRFVMFGSSTTVLAIPSESLAILFEVILKPERTVFMQFRSSITAFVKELSLIFSSF